MLRNLNLKRVPALFFRLFLNPTVHTDPESNHLAQKVQKTKSLYRKIALITFVEDFLEHKKLIFFIA